MWQAHLFAEDCSDLCACCGMTLLARELIEPSWFVSPGSPKYGYDLFRQSTCRIAPLCVLSPQLFIHRYGLGVASCSEHRFQLVGIDVERNPQANYRSVIRFCNWCLYFNNISQYHLNASSQRPSSAMSKARVIFSVFICPDPTLISAFIAFDSSETLSNTKSRTSHLGATQMLTRIVL